jgi:NADH-quinone oxidoreductase subunit M
MGVFGIIHWLFAMVPAAIPSVQQPVLILALIGILYASIIAIQQRDYKRLIAYASMAHVGVIVCGLFSAHVQGIQGALFQSVSHGLTVVGLLLVCDILEHRFGSQTISNLGGIRNTHPWFAVLFLCITMGAVALPLTSSFIGEFLIFNGLFSYSPLIMGLAGISVILGAVYMLRSYQGIMLGQHTANTTATIPKAHYILLTVVMALIILLGLFPKPINDLAASAATTLVHTLKPGI